MLNRVFNTWRYRKLLLWGMALWIISACAGDGRREVERVIWNPRGSTQITTNAQLRTALARGPVRILIDRNAPAAIVRFQGIQLNFLDNVARGADTGARHGVLLGSVGLHGSCVNSGCAVLLLISAALAVGGAAIGAIVGAVDGGVQALTASDSTALIAQREGAMTRALAALPLRAQMAVGVRQQLHERPGNRFFLGLDSKTGGRTGKKTGKEPNVGQYRLYISHITLTRQRDSAMARLSIKARGHVIVPTTGAGRATVPVALPPVLILSSEFLTDPYPISAWFADNGKHFRETLLLGAQLTSQRLVAKLQERIAAP